MEWSRKCSGQRTWETDNEPKGIANIIAKHSSEIVDETKDIAKVLTNIGSHKLDTKSVKNMVSKDIKIKDMIKDSNDILRDKSVDNKGDIKDDQNVKSMVLNIARFKAMIKDNENVIKEHTDEHLLSWYRTKSLISIHSVIEHQVSESGLYSR